MTTWLAVLNTAVALTTVGFGVVTLARPAQLAPPGAATDRFHAAMYAARAIPLGLAVAVAVWLPVGSSLLLLLGVAVLAQLADVAIGAVHRLPGMVAGAALAAVCHGAALLAAARH